MEEIKDLFDLAIYLVDKIRELGINIDPNDIVEEFCRKQKNLSIDTEKFCTSTFIINRYGFSSDLRKEAYEKIPLSYQNLIDEFLNGFRYLSFNTT